MMKWSKLGLSWMGRIAAVTMKVLPRYLFIFQNVILYIPQAILNKIQGLLNRFIRNYKKPCVISAVLKLNPQQGELEISQFNLYYHAVILFE